MSPTVLPSSRLQPLSSTHQTSWLILRQQSTVLTWKYAGPSSKTISPLTRLYPSARTTTLINYLETTWLYSTVYRRELWNMYESVKNEDPRTNNISEGGNYSLNTSAACSHPTTVPFYKDGDTMLSKRLS